MLIWCSCCAIVSNCFRIVLVWTPNLPFKCMYTPSPLGAESLSNWRMISCSGLEPLIITRWGPSLDICWSQGRALCHSQNWSDHRHFDRLRAPSEMCRRFSHIWPDCWSVSTSSPCDWVPLESVTPWLVSSTKAPTCHAAAISFYVSSNSKQVMLSSAVIQSNALRRITTRPSQRPAWLLLEPVVLEPDNNCSPPTIHTPPHPTKPAQLHHQHWRRQFISNKHNYDRSTYPNIF